jgi:exodeoxyribonuclease V alpha subunit
MNLDASQQSAIERATSSRVSLITGGAGTGKTTIVKAITANLEAKGEKVHLCAFAGKAAARLREACEHPASTIHRLLAYNGSVFLNPSLSGSTVVVDESSMIDSQLLAEIVRRNPNRLCLVGDAAQLAPVGRGQPFHDILDLRRDLVSSLTRCYRATEAVFQAATAIRNGGRPPMDATSDGERWTMRNTGDEKRTQAEILKWIEDGFFDFEQDVILVARNGETDKEPCTVRGLNKAIVDLISPRDEKTKFVVGDRVICVKNIPKKDVWNGTTCTVHAVDHDGGVWVKTDIPVIDWSKTTDESDPKYTSYVLFGRDIRMHLNLAYALTVHKSQGSQYRHVLMACFNRDGWGLLDRSLLYTAVTRAKVACCVVGEMASVWAAIDRVNKKKTVLQMLGDDQ